MEAHDPEEMMIAFGGNIKTTRQGDIGMVEGLGVLFGNANQLDLEGDYFDERTYYGPRGGDDSSATLNHAIPLVTASTKAAEIPVLEKFARRRFTNPIKTEKTELGILARHALDLKNEYERWVFDMTEKGVFKWSSGALPHLVERADDGHLERWEIGEFAYTPRPAEPRLPTIAPLKSLKSALMADESKALAAVYPNLKALQEDGRDLSDDATETEAEAEIEIKSEMENPIMSEQTQQAPAPADNSAAILEAIKGIADNQKAFTERLEALETAPVNAQPPAVNVDQVHRRSAL